LEISRETIHNYLETHKYFGIEGLIHGYNPADSKSLEAQRRLHGSERAQGNKAEQVAAIRAEQREAEKAQRESVQAALNFSFGENDRSRKVPAEQQPFSQNHAWEATRYAGVFLYWIALVTQWSWLHLIMGHFGKAWRIFAVFLLMGGTKYPFYRAAQAGTQTRSRPRIGPGALTLQNHRLGMVLCGGPLRPGPHLAE